MSLGFSYDNKGANHIARDLPYNQDNRHAGFHPGISPWVASSRGPKEADNVRAGQSRLLQLPSQIR